MEKGTVSKKVNEDFIPVVHLNGSNLEYTEIIIEKKYEYLISLIKKALKNNNLLLIEIQNTFSYIFTGEPKGYSYCFPHDYSEAFIDSADYPKIYSQEEYDSEINKVREDYINNEKEKVNKEKEEGKIDDHLYQEAIERVKEAAEEKVNNRIAELKNSFLKKSIRYIQAYEFYTALKKIKADESNVMYSTEIIGWTKFNYSINKNVVVNFKSNFCYGRSAYFHITLIYKGIEILSYPKLVQYYHANMLDFIDCTESFKPERHNWKPALSFVVDQSNWAVKDEDAFVQKWIIDGTNEMVLGLKEIFNSPNTVIDNLIKSNIDDSLLYAVRNITKDEIAEYEVYRHEMTIAFQAEKISGSLLLTPNLTKLCSLYPKIKSIIHEIESINREFFPQLHNAIVTLSNKIESLSNKIDSLQTEYSTFKRNNYRHFRDYDIFKARNRDNPNVHGDYIKLHPEFESLYNKKIKYEEDIEKFTNELKRLSKYQVQLSRCAQLICDYGLTNSFSDNYLSTSVSIAQSLLFVTDNNIKMSKSKRRLFKYLGLPSQKEIVILDSIRVICDNSITGSHIQNLTLPLGLKKIGYCNFQCCDNLREVRIPDSVIEIGSDVFYGCKSLQKVYLSNSLKKISSFSFNKCTSLKNIAIPESVITIGRGAFLDCTSLQIVTLPNSIEIIEESAFKGCNSLKTIYIPIGTTEKYQRLLPAFKNLLIESKRTPI